MPATGNLGFDMTPLPSPQSAPVQVSTFADEAKQNQTQMPPVYYGGKTGSVAFMADKVLTGWLAGTKMAHEKKAKAMADEVGAAKTGLDYIGQAYKAAVESGDEKKIAETKGALSEAYKDYIDKAEKYAIPEQQMGADGKPKKQGIGSKIKQGLKGGENPHMNIAHSTLDIMRKTDPTQLYGPSKREQAENKVLDMQTKQMEQKQQDDDRWAKASQQDPTKQTPEDKRFLEYYEYKNFGQTPAQQKMDQMKDGIMTKVMGNQPLSEQEHQVAESLGLVKPAVTSTTTRTIRGAKGEPQTQLVSIGPDGKMVASQILPGTDYIPPDQAQIAGSVINAQMSAMKKWGQKAHPEWDDKTLTTWALSTVAGGSGGATMDWYTKNNQMDVMNRALGAVLQKHTKEYKGADGTPQTQRDDLASAMLGNVVSTTEDGRYAYMPQLAAGQKDGGSSWYKPWSWGSGDGTEKWSGMTREQLNDSERRFQAELRAELKKQNPKLPDSDLDKMVPSMLTSQQQTQAMQPPPQQKQSTPQMATPPAGGQGDRSYTVTLPDGTKASRTMSPEYADALAARGVKVEPVGQ